MNFLFPAFLLGALAIALPVALHLLRRDVAPEVPFTAVRLIARSPIERSDRRRLRDLLLLTARVAALLLLAFAFARPYLTGASAAPAPLRIVAIDRSYSMAAPGTFERALALARSEIDGAHSTERLAVIAFDDRAEVIAPPGGAGEARAALVTFAPGFGATRYAGVIARAADLAGGDPATLVIVTDLQRAGWEDERQPAVPSTLAVEVRDAGGIPPNATLAAIRVEADRVIATVRAAGSRREGRLSLQRDGREVASAPYRAEAGGSADVAVPWRAAGGGGVTASIDDPGGLQADNTRFVSLDRARPRLLLVTSGSAAAPAFYVSRALDAAGSEGLPFDTRAVSGAALSSLPDDEVARHAGVVLLSTRGIDRRGREKLAALVRGGGGLFVAAAADVEAAALTGMFEWQPALSAVEQAEEGVTLAATDVRHPIFRPFGALAANLGQVRFTRSWQVRAEGWEVAARFTDGSPALLERAVGSGRVVLFASDVDRRWNDFPLHPSFVPFVVEAVRYVSGGALQTAEYTVASVPAGTPATPGVHAVGGRLVAVNVDPLEGSAARLSAEEFGAMFERVEAPAARAEVRAQQAESAQGYWRYGLLLMIAALVGESIVGRAS